MYLYKHWLISVGENPVMVIYPPLRNVRLPFKTLLLILKFTNFYSYQQYMDVPGLSQCLLYCLLNFALLKLVAASNCSFNWYAVAQCWTHFHEICWLVNICLGCILQSFIKVWKLGYFEFLYITDGSLLLETWLTLQFYYSST